MQNVTQWLSASPNFMPHGMCYLWQPGTLWLNVASDALIAAAYYAIPVALYYLVRGRRAEIPYPGLFLMFAAFILLCGTTHLMEIWTVWHPDYRVGGALKGVTGIVSVVTMLALFKVIPQAMLLRSPQQLQVEVDARTAELEQVNVELRAQIDARDRAESQVYQTSRDLQFAQNEQQKTSVLLHTIVNTTPGVIFAKDKTGRMLLANAAALRLIGKPWSEVKGRTDAEFLTEPAQGHIIMANDRRVLETGREESVEEHVGADIWLSTKAPFRDAAGEVRGLVGVSVDITERKQIEERLRQMVNELNHRVKNTLITVQSIASHTLRGTPTTLRATLEERLGALASAHDILTREKWEGAKILDIVSGVLAPHGSLQDARFSVSGPPLRLVPRAALAMSMGLHELVTNALKYGALCVETGQVAIAWEISPDKSEFRFRWQERNGPAVTPPGAHGFGTSLIEHGLAHDLGGTAQIRFEPAGVVCEIRAPLKEILATATRLQYPPVGIIQ